jgi:hypothetical protein
MIVTLAFEELILNFDTFNLRDSLFSISLSLFRRPPNAFDGEKTTNVDPNRSQCKSYPDVCPTSSTQMPPSIDAI